MTQLLTCISLVFKLAFNPAFYLLLNLHSMPLQSVAWGFNPSDQLHIHQLPRSIKSSGFYNPHPVLAAPSIAPWF
jgi:hypothetical protein